MKTYGDYDEFKKFVGLIDDDDVLGKLGLITDEPCGGFCTSRLEELKTFCKENTDYHIITELDPYDDDEGLTHYCIDNSVRIVNRSLYLLGNGSRLNCLFDEE